MIDKEQFSRLSHQLVNGLLREAIGYRIQQEIPYYQGIVGYMVETPMLWIRYTRFPVFFVAYDQHHPDILAAVVKQLELARASEYFALLVVVPTQKGTGNEAEELRQRVANSVYHHDFIVLDRYHVESIIARNNAQRLIEIIQEQGIELASLSPYVVKGPVPENMFFGREREIKRIAQTIQTNDYALVGGRRIGKSSMLLRLKQILGNDSRFFVTYLNCEEQFTTDDFLGVIADEFESFLHGNQPDNFRQLVTLLRQAQPGRQIVLLFDEIDQLLVYDSQNEQGRLFHTFRALSHERACRFVFSGSRTLHWHLHNAQSPFFNFCEEMPLKPLDEKSAREIILKPMQQLGITLSDEPILISHMIELTSCHPSIVQWFCHQLLQQVRTRRIALHDLNAVAHSQDFAEYFIETAWGDSRPMEKFVSLLIDGIIFNREMVMTAAANYGVTDEQAIRHALQILELYALIESKEKNYQFVLTQFPRLARSLEDVPFLIRSLLTQLEH